MTTTIDRAALVRRHNPRVTAPERWAVFSVGNGSFAFNADVTGLQCFAEEYEQEIPLCTASHWGWHVTPPSPGVDPSRIAYKQWDTYGRAVGYLTSSKNQKAEYDWLRENPHRFHLGQLRFENERGERITPGQIHDVDQQLDLWTGILTSRFRLQGEPVQVITCCDPTMDLLAVQVDSPLLASGRLRVAMLFPYGSSAMSMADWEQPDRHETRIVASTPNSIDLQRSLDDTTYHVQLAWHSDAKLDERGAHTFTLTPEARRLAFVAHFTSQPAGDRKLPDVDGVQRASAAHWQTFWSEGGAIDLAGSTDPRAEELERRIVLSQYQTAIHSAGPLPSAETGLLCNSWYGKFHTEMHWWHSVHFAAWGRFDLFERSLPFYHDHIELARATARRQGYAGARWQKMAGPDGRDSPSPIAPLLIWQQPHPIYYAELCYRHNPSRETLDKWAPIVFDTAEFMASFAVFEEGPGHYSLGPPLATVSENQPHDQSKNATFELSYWRFGLRVAQLWRQRLGMAPCSQWDQVRTRLAPLSTQDGCYLLQEGATETYTKWNWEHPALVGPLGMMPGDGVDVSTMHRTLRRVMATWDWSRKSWGWDFPMTAMCAARVGEPELAVDALLLPVPKNQYLRNGHNYQRPNLPAYLPGNGGLLAAAAMMASGWTDGPTEAAPGFPRNGKWQVRSEGLEQWM